ncbi:MAG: ATP-binding protein [Methanobacteriota archaeon]
MNNTLSEYEGEFKRKKIIDPLVRLETWENFADILFEKCRDRIVIFDEFQNFREIYPAIFSVFQRKFDENKDIPILMIFSGSLIGMIKRTFEDMKVPLYGRVKTKIKLAPLSYKDTRTMLNILGYKNEADFVEFFSIFGGIPKYYVAIEDFELEGKPLIDVLTYLFLRENAPFGYEVLDVLRQEFGKRKGTYTIINPVIAFWFRYIHRNITLFEGKNFLEIIGIIKKDLGSYEGRRFEIVGREFFTELNSNRLLPFRFSKIGTWWGPYRDGGERKTAEIDIVALSDLTKEILFIECKWQDKVDAKKILAELKEKTKFVNWNNDKRKEHYAIFARSFKDKFKEPDVLLLDLNDMEKMFLPNKKSTSIRFIKSNEPSIYKLGK